ncbi:TPA: hypothetical protein ACH3X1_013696 [Trebouxia sp. C0004]
MLDATAAKHLARGTWSCLNELDLQENNLEDDAMAFLAKGQWLTLTVLRLHGNDVTVLGLELLMAGQWPILDRLVLDRKAFSAATWTLLGLVSESKQVPLLEDVEGDMRYNAQVFGSFGSNVVNLARPRAVWPSLRQVWFRRGRLKVPGIGSNRVYRSL